jgi:hypothetical protein
VRQRLLAVPQRVAPMVAGETLPAACAALIEAEICEALAELAAGDGVPAATRARQRAAGDASA